MRVLFVTLAVALATLSVVSASGILLESDAMIASACSNAPDAKVYNYHTQGRGCVEVGSDGTKWVHPAEMSGTKMCKSDDCDKTVSPQLRGMDTTHTVTPEYSTRCGEKEECSNTIVDDKVGDKASSVVMSGTHGYAEEVDSKHPIKAILADGEARDGKVVQCKNHEHENCDEESVKDTCEDECTKKEEESESSESESEKQKKLYEEEMEARKEEQKKVEEDEEELKEADKENKSKKVEEEEEEQEEEEKEEEHKKEEEKEEEKEKEVEEEKEEEEEHKKEETSKVTKDEVEEQVSKAKEDLARAEKVSEEGKGAIEDIKKEEDKLTHETEKLNAEEKKLDAIDESKSSKLTSLEARVTELEAKLETMLKKEGVPEEDKLPDNTPKSDNKVEALEKRVAELENELITKHPFFKKHDISDF
jgi:hypothetical protein